MSTREGSVSRAKLDGKIVAIYFAPAINGELSRALREVYDEKSHAFEVVLVSSASSAEEFSASFREMPWLAIPFTHSQRRRRLRSLFEVPDGASQVVLVSPEGQTITREGGALLELAHSCASALRTKEKKEKDLTSECDQVEKERDRLAQQMLALKPLEAKMQGYARRLSKLRTSELDEIAQFVAEPKLPAAAQAALESSGAKLEAAKATLRALPGEALEHMRTTEQPSGALRAAVEAVCVLLSSKPDFASAQNRLMRIGTSSAGQSNGLVRKMLSFDPDTVPKAASNRLRHFLEAPPPAAAAGEEEAVAAALRAWVEAVLDLDLANDEAKMSVEQHSCTVAMQTACECVCDLYGMHAIDDDLRGVLQMAAAFPQVDADAPDEKAQEVADEQQLEGLQQKVYRLKQFLVMLHKDMEASSLAAGPKRDDMRAKAGCLNDRYTFNSALAGNSNDEIYKAALTALLLMLQPEALAKEPDVFKAAATWISPMKRDMWEKFYNSVRGLEGEINEGRTKQEDWAKVKSLAEYLAQNTKGHRFRAGSQLSLVLCEWVLAASDYHELSSEMAAKKKQYDALKKELQAAQKELDEVIDRGDQPDGISPTLIKSVLKAAREAGTPIPRDQAVWVLKRTNGNESTAIEMITCQTSAWLALQVLREPGLLQGFAGELLKGLTGAQVRKVRSALRVEGVKELVDRLTEEEEEEEEEDEAEAEAEEGGDESGLAERVLRLLAMKTDECQQLAAVVEEARAAGMDSSNPRLMLAERNLAMRYQEIKELAAFGAPTPPPRGGGLIQRPLGSARPTRCPLGRLLSAPCHTAPSTILPPCRSRRHPAAHKLGLDMGDDDDEEEEDEEDGGGGGTMTAVAAAQEEAAEAALEKVQRLQAELDACVQELRIVDEKANPKVN